MLQAEHVSYRVNGSILLDAVSASFPPGTLSVILGPNGAGKSTFVRLLCGRLTPTSGVVRWDGRPLGAWQSRERARVRAVLSQSIDVAFPLRVREVVMMGRYPHFTGEPEPKDHRACEEAMTLFDVHGLGDRNYLTLSGGERQRVQFARVLAQIWYPPAGGRRYLVLDEPLTFLDVRHQLDFMRCLGTLLSAGDLVVVGVVHDLNLAARFADRLVLLSHGRLIAAGAPEEVLTPPLLRDVFSVDALVARDPATGRHRLFLA